MMQPLYLDHNATSPMPAPVRAAMAEAMERFWGNPSSPHRAGRDAAAALDRARTQVAEMLGREPREVAFVSGATEGNAQVLSGLATADRPEVLASAVEHPSVRAWATREVPVDRRGVVDLESLAALLDELGGRVAVVSVMAANNETGVLQPTGEVASICRRSGVPFHCDLTQLPGRLPAHVGADVVTLSAHKFGGPKGVGAVATSLDLPPLLRGGGQERGRRPGTPDVPAIVAMGVACELAGSMDPGERDRLEAACRALAADIVGDGAPRLPNTVTALFDVPGDVVVAALDLDGIAASTGSACASGAGGHSHVLAAMGLSGARGHGIPVRFSLAPDSRVDPAIAALGRVLARTVPEAMCASS